jgi:hypothetical protein
MVGYRGTIRPLRSYSPGTAPGSIDSYGAWRREPLTRMR